MLTEEPEAVPELSLEKSKYTLGERIRANCSSSAAFPAANLTFFINSVQVTFFSYALLTLIFVCFKILLEATLYRMQL